MPFVSFLAANTRATSIAKHFWVDLLLILAVRLVRLRYRNVHPTQIGKMMRRQFPLLPLFRIHLHSHSLHYSAKKSIVMKSVQFHQGSVDVYARNAVMNVLQWVLPLRALTRQPKVPFR